MTSNFTSTPLEQSNSYTVGRDGPAPNIVAASQHAQLQRAVDSSHEKLAAAQTEQGQELQTEQSTSAPETATEGSSFPSVELPSFSDAIAAEQVAEDEAKQADQVLDPPQVDKQAMADNFNTDLNAADMEEEKLAGLSNIPEEPNREVVYNTDLLDTVEKGDRIEASKQELDGYLQGQTGGVLTNALRAIDYVFAPAMSSVAAVTGSLANSVNTGSFLGDLRGNAIAAGDAFNERFFRWFNGDGDVMPDYSAKIVEKYMPGVPEEYRSSVGGVVEMLVTLPMSFGMASAMQKAISGVSQLQRTESFSGLMKEAVYSFLGWSPGAGQFAASTKRVLDEVRKDGESYKQAADRMLKDADDVDLGDRAAFVRLNEEMSGVEGIPVVTTEQALKSIEETMGGGVNSASVIISQSQKAGGGGVDQAKLTQQIQSRVAENDVRFNLSSITDGRSAQASIDQATDQLSARYRQQEGLNPDIPTGVGPDGTIPTGFKSQSNARTMELARQNQSALEELYGIPLDRMNMDEAQALRVITGGSMVQLMEYTAILNNPSASRFNQDLAKAAFAKQLMVHQLIQAKVTGAFSTKAQFLQSKNAEAYLDQFNFKVCN